MKKGKKRLVLCAPTGSGKTVMFTFMVSEHIKKGGNVIYKKLEPTKPTPKVGKKEKTSPPTKGEKTQVYKAIYISKNIIRGDISEIAKQLGVSVGHVSAVLNGAYENKTILDLAYTFLLERKGM